MNKDFLSTENLLLWLEECRGKNTLIAPQKLNELLLFTRVENVSNITLDYINTQLSPKEWFLPKSDTLFKIEGLKPSDWSIQPGDDIEETIIFGMRPCDSWGIEIMDKPYLAAPTDSRYQERRAKTITIGMACIKAASSCFCTSMGTLPKDSEHNDVFLIPTQGGYKVKGISEKGKKLLSSAKLVENSTETFPAPIISPVPSKDIEKAFRNNFDSKYWERVGDRCIHCNICSYVCPNCYCFDMRDLSIHGPTAGYERVRTWESCQSPAFTKLAGGHNPRSGKGARIRQRFAHKLLYFHDEYGNYLCSGCGRCVWACPVNIDIREIITDVQRLEATGYQEKGKGDGK